MNILLLIAIGVATWAPFSVLATLFLLPVVLVRVWGHRLQDTPQYWLMSGWLLWLPVSLFFSQAPGLSLAQASMLLCLPLAYLMGLLLRSRGQLDWILRYGLAGLLIVLIVWGVVQGPNTFTEKPQGPFNDPNAYAALLNLLVLPLLARYLAANLPEQSSLVRVGQLALLASTAYLEFLVSSRGAVLSLLIVLPALLWMARTQTDLIRKILLLCVVLVVAYFAALYTSGGLSVAQRLAETLEGGDPHRLMLMKSALSMIQEHPWLGTGLGTFRLFYPRYRYSSEYASAGGWVHNDYLQLWLEAGMPMLLLMLFLMLWIIYLGLHTLKMNGHAGLFRMGYLTGIFVIFIHASVNFLFYFSLVSLLVGLYLARVVKKDKITPPLTFARKSNGNGRAIRMATIGYVVILGYLLIGQLAVDGLLGHSQQIQRILWKWQVAYPRYQVAYWCSILAPFHPSPPQIMGLELSKINSTSGENGGEMHLEALARMKVAQHRAPCYLPYTNDALSVIINGPITDFLRVRGKQIVAQNLDCNARDGLSYFYAGQLASSPIEALMWWHAGLAASLNLGERLLLATAILSNSMPERQKELKTLMAKMEQAIRFVESNPGKHADYLFWNEVQYQLGRIAGQRIVDLVPPI